MPLAELKNKYRRISELEKARSGWEDEYEVSSKQVTVNIFLFDQQKVTLNKNYTSKEVASYEKPLQLLMDF